MPRSRAQLEKAAADAEKWLDELDPDDPNLTVETPGADLRQVAYALGAVNAAENAVAAAVSTARSNGRSWTEIARVLGMTRQAVQKRYDHPAEV